MRARDAFFLTSTTALLLALPACTERQSLTSSPERDLSISRQQAETTTAEVQARIIDAFPPGSVRLNQTSDVTLLVCSETEIQSSLGAQIDLNGPVPVQTTFRSILHELEPDGYVGERETTPQGAELLVLTGGADDQYFVNVFNDTRRVRIASFSPCFVGSLTDR